MDRLLSIKRVCIVSIVSRLLPNSLIRTMLWAAPAKFGLVKKRLYEGKIAKAKKLILYTYRYLQFTKQLIEKV